ncbi:MAG TPA: protein kinase [Gemmatimonadales bacterium]|nr:protein kinase [Gemmatimonadales bacterium]
MNERQRDLAQGLSGRYVLERELGRGGMASVWLARDLRYDRMVALKVLHSDLAASLGGQRFLREIMLAARLQHPHVVPVYDSGEVPSSAVAEPPILWFTMPWIDGESLRDRLRREGRVSTAEAVRIAREVARGLQYAHEQGVIHRDVKPENILLTRDGSTMVADFGIARPARTVGTEHLTGTGVVIGTPVYMSPEQAVGGEVDARTDVYALGCVLYEMLTGGPPFGGATVQEVVARHLTEPPPLSGTRVAQIPARLRIALGRALAKSPKDRPASAALFAESLGEEGGKAPTGSRRRTAMLAGLSGAAGLAAFLALRSPAGEPTPISSQGTIASGFARRLTQLTSQEGLEEWPTWSPDGRQLAYVAEVDGYRQLFVRQLSEGTERQLTDDRRDHIQPAWSSDGAHIAFVRGATATGRLEPDEVDGYYFEGAELWTVEIGSGVASKLLDGGFNPSYSPDGQRLAFDAELAGAQRVWVADTRGRNPRQVTSDSSEAVVHTEPRWSPDGTKLAFRRIEKLKSDIAIVDPATQAVTRVTDDYVVDVYPTWTPDGRAVVFSSSRGGGVNLWRARLGPDGTTTGLEQLTTGAGDDVQASVHPDGRELAFAVRGISSDLWQLPVSPETGRATGLPAPVLGTTRVESRGTWSPDGRLLAFNSDRAGEMNIWVLDSARRERRVTSGPGGDYQPDWSPDGAALVFFSARGGNTDIWRVRLADTALTRLTENPALDINPAYSPDGQRIAFVSDRSGRFEVWVMQADGTGQKQVASVGCWGHFLAWTADSRAIVFRGEHDRQMQIYRVDVASGALTPLPPVRSGGHMSFSPSQSLIMDVSSHKVLWAHPLGGAEPYEVYQFPDPDVRIDYPRWSRDGGRVVFDRAAPRGADLWMLEGF